MVKSIFTNLTIKDMPADMRPRERLLHSGAKYLSDVELLAIILSTGVKGMSALELSQRLLQNFGGLGRLGNVSSEEFSSSTGVGHAKAARILAALEMGKRIAGKAPSKKFTVSSSDLVAELMMPSMRYLEKEYFKALILNSKNHLLKVEDIAVGSLNGAIIHPRELYRAAVKVGAAGVIVVHNHPSGDSTPSREDIALTKRLVEAGRIVGIELLDHVIIGDGRYVSLKELKYI